jgi:alpha-1,2-mannosyltransferase
MMRLERIIGPLPGEREARAFGVAGIGVALIACALSLYFGLRGETFLGRPLGSDFVQFYAAGKILNQHQPARLFDIPYLAQVEHESLPTMSKTQMLIFGNAPFVAALFRPLALLPYTQAYCVWLVISAALYCTALAILLRGRITWWMMALSTPMFTLETWIGGQISIFAFLAFAICVRLFTDQRYFLAGLALGLAAYKPSLVAIPAAMFLAGRCWRMLGGLLTTGSLILAASIATVGMDGIELWLRTLRAFRYLATDPESIISRSKYVDLNSFLTGLFGTNAIVTNLALVMVAAAVLVLAWIWWRSAPQAHPLLFAATIAGTLVLNVYVPVYDTIILIPALVLVAGARMDEERRRQFQIWIIVFCLIPWLTQSAADFLRLQILTVAIAGFCYWMLAYMGQAVSPVAKRPDYEHPTHYPQ